MRLVIKLLTDGTYIAYFDGLPKFYGKGDTREAAIKDLTEKTRAVLTAIGSIQKGR